MKNDETYDAARVVIKHVDQNGSLMQYSNRVIKIETEGPIKVLGDSAQALLGGQLSLFVFSKNEPGKSRLMISMDGIVKEIKF